ncbi:MAG: transcriptional regulator, LuxR family, partial [Solirubrobacterales bacterium]|nr:transcriptional regulator, LuxR family [Solirubrobacterales bacterium]
MRVVPSTDHDRSRPSCTPTSISTSPRPTPPTSGAAPSTSRLLSPAEPFAFAAPSRDTGGVATRMTARVFVGRGPQLAELGTALGEAAAGRGSLVFLAGEPGLGKTRLLDELHRRVRDSGAAQVLAGDCLALGDGELPYAPLVGALRPLARAGDPVLATLPDATRAALATLVPSLAGTHGTSLPPNPEDPAAQSRVFEALLELIDALAARTPVVLTLEDLHWADASTRAFLRFLSVNLCRERVLVVGSYRPDELHRRHPLRPLLAELERDARTRRITLGPLSREELAEQLEDLVGAEPSEDLLERMYRRSEGNPLFTEELVAAGTDGRGTLPPTLRDALMVRIERLSDDAQDLLRLVAVARSVDHVTLTACATASGRALSDGLREAIEAQILTVDDDERYRFRHALLREAVGDDLLPGERVELHLGLAKALDRTGGAGVGTGTGVYRATAVAHHYQAAGDQPAALEASVRAAWAAEQVHASGEAAALLERALELWDRVPDAAAVCGTGEVQLLERAAKAHLAEGDNVRVETLLRRALELVGEADPVASSRLLEKLARARWNQNRQTDTLATLDRSLALLPEGASPERAWRTAGKARFQMLMGRYRDAAETARSAVALALQTGSPRAEGSALNSLGVSLAALGDVDGGSDALRRAQQIARENADADDLATAAVNLADVLHLAGRTPEAIIVAEDALAHEAPAGRQETWLRIALAEFLIDAGRPDEGARLLAHVSERHQGTLLLNALLRQAELALVQGDAAAAEEALRRATRGAEGSREPQFIAVLYALLAEHRARAGDLAAAREAVEEGLDRIEFCTDDVHRITRLAATGVRVEADIAQRARDLGDAGNAADAARRAALLAERVATGADGDDAHGRPVEHAHWLTSSAEQGRAAGLAEPGAWVRAASAWDRLGRPYAAALARWREAEALVLTGQRDRAASTVSDVRATAAVLGAHHLLAEVDALAARARLR